MERFCIDGSSSHEEDADLDGRADAVRRHVGLPLVRSLVARLVVQ